MLLEKQLKSPYVFSSQFQQDPIPAGGAIYKTTDFIYLDDEPEMLCTFITADTAETNKTYNDATVFSFWGLYKIIEGGAETGQLALHWLDCVQMWVEPKELKDEFMGFYTTCMRHKVKPLVAAIEKKSTGTTLISLLSDVRGLTIRDIQRTKASGSKTERFLEIQPVVASKMITFTHGAKHAGMCVEHMAKITANDTHRNDDIADTLYDACKIALLDKTLYHIEDKQDDVVSSLANAFNQKSNTIDRTRYG
jgi:predicted phage terminase large subunit-like protein